MGSSGSSESRSTGGDYSGKLYFDPEADKDIGTHYYIKDDELIEKIRGIIDINEPILEIRIYKNPLSNAQLTKFYHAFILFETKDWWWTIEKNSEGVTVQRCKYIEYVREKYRRKDRLTSVDLIKKVRGSGTVLDLIRIVYKKDLLGSKYNVLENNCQTFASIIFNNCNGDGASWYP
ncbi:unnamed protein product [Brachionus calyciflorus]|uniref:Uncharacterized protein n=1 Tax=Brachionus calyciflorus TaxID=104777 RepID=A0A813R9R0_9BILA|nr:unnamed protein product [Brachionus calyciflorus]